MENNITPFLQRVFVLSVEKTYLTLIHDEDYNSTALKRLWRVRI